MSTRLKTNGRVNTAIGCRHGIHNALLIWQRDRVTRSCWRTFISPLFMSCFSLSIGWLFLIFIGSPLFLFIYDIIGDVALMSTFRGDLRFLWTSLNAPDISPGLETPTLLFPSAQECDPTATVQPTRATCGCFAESASCVSATLRHDQALESPVRRLQNVEPLNQLLGLRPALR